MHVYNSESEDYLGGLFGSPVAVVERVRERLSIVHPCFVMDPYGGEVRARVYFYETEELMESDLSDLAALSFSNATAVAEISDLGACTLVSGG